MYKPLSYIEISQSNLIHNFREFKKFLSSKMKIVCVVKANAYGHGQDEVVNALKTYTDYFQVDDLLELKRLRGQSKKPTLILGYIANSELRETIKLKGIPAIYDIKRAKLLNSIGKKLHKAVPVHIKIDALLGRQGLTIEHIPKFIADIKNLKNIKVEGIYSHFANIEDTASFAHAQRQINTFQKAKNLFEQAGYNDFLTHISATSGVMVYEQNLDQNNLARIGIGLYGMYPSSDLSKKYSQIIQLKPVMRWITHIAQIKTLPKGYPIGYGLTYITSKATKVAVIPQGYSDGYDRGLSNKGWVLIKGKKCKVLGRVAMNMFVVNISHIKNAIIEDEVVLLGSQQNSLISAEQIANLTGTINYEVTTRISPFLPRIIA